jgi:hypothetical protein
MNNNMNVTGQLEFSINGHRPAPISRRQRTRIERAAWWFAKMRHAVEAASDWDTKPNPPGQQLWIEATHRRIAA